jgi:Sulfotransferase domain
MCRDGTTVPASISPDKTDQRSRPSVSRSLCVVNGVGHVRDRVARAVPPAGLRALRGAAQALGTITSGARVVPDFLLIGAQRGGTTTLYHYLVRHPQILGAVLDKEVHYFDLHANRRLAWYRARFPTARFRSAVQRRAGAAMVGEATPYYLFHPGVPRRVAAALPTVKAVAMLRDPVERAWSHYRHEVDLGYETLSFEEAIACEPERLAGEDERLADDVGAVSFEHQHHSYLARGRYAEQLERWFAALGRDRVHVVKSEDFFSDPSGEFVQVLDFLGASRWQPPAWRTLNAATSTGMDPATRQRLRDAFRPHDQRLTTLLGWDHGWDR